MPDLQMSHGVRRRSRGSVRGSELLNMFLEADETAPDGFARQSRQGLGVNRTVGGGPINGLFSHRGVFDDDLFAVSGNTLFRASTSLGIVPGSGPVSFTAGRVELLVTRGDAPYSYDGSDLADAGVMDDDDNPYDVRAVGYLGGYFIAVRDGTNRFYWSASQDGRTWDGLDFAAAESSPDELIDVYVVNDSLWLMGEESVEAWQLTGDADAPFARIEGLLLKKGIIATGCAAELDNTLFWWGHDNMIYRAGQGVPLRVSDNGIEEQLQGSVEKAVFSFTFEGHAFLAVRTDTGTFVLDVSLPQPVWSEFGTWGRDNWRARTATTAGGDLIFGDDEDGRIWAFEDDNWDDGDVLERRWSAGFPGSGNIVVHVIGIIGNPGDTPLLSGQGSAPVLEIRSSRDNGKTFGDWRSASLGSQGRYRQRIEKRRWGLFDRQGGYFEFRVTDPVPIRASRVFANEPSGGRTSG